MRCISATLTPTRAHDTAIRVYPPMELSSLHLTKRVPAGVQAAVVSTLLSAWLGASSFLTKALNLACR